MKGLVSLGLCLMLSLVLIFGSVFSSPSSFIFPNNAFAADMGDMGGDSGGDNSQGGGNNQGGDSGDGEDNNDDDDSDGMPNSKEAPPTSGALATGGDSDNDNDDDNDNDNNNDKDDESTSEDEPVTTDTPTDKKLVCPKGQEVALFSTSCKPVGGAGNSGNTGDTTQSATSCPTGHTPTSYGNSDEFLLTNLLWGFNNNYGINTVQRDTQHTVLLHLAALPEYPGLKPDRSDPTIRALCTGKEVTVRNPDDNSIDVYHPDGFRTNIIEDKNTGYSRITEYTAKGITETTTKILEDTGKLIQTVVEKDATSGKVTGTVFDTDTGNPSMTFTIDPKSGLTQRDFYDPATKEPTKKEVKDPNSKTELVTTFVPGSTTRATVELFDYQSHKLKMQIKYKADGVTPAETINYGDDGKPLPK